MLGIRAGTREGRAVRTVCKSRCRRVRLPVVWAASGMPRWQLVVFRVCFYLGSPCCHCGHPFPWRVSVAKVGVTGGSSLTSVAVPCRRVQVALKLIPLSEGSSKGTWSEIEGKHAHTFIIQDTLCACSSCLSTICLWGSLGVGPRVYGQGIPCCASMKLRRLHVQRSIHHARCRS